MNHGPTVTAKGSAGPNEMHTSGRRHLAGEGAPAVPACCLSRLAYMQEVIRLHQLHISKRLERIDNVLRGKPDGSVTVGMPSGRQATLGTGSRLPGDDTDCAVRRSGRTLGPTIPGQRCCFETTTGIRSGAGFGNPGRHHNARQRKLNSVGRTAGREELPRRLGGRNIWRVGNCELQ